MQYLKLFSGLLLIAILSSSCAALQANKRLSSHTNLLNDAAMSNISTEKKLDVLAGSFVQLMHEGMDFVNVKKGVNYVNRYNTQNKKSIDTIFKEVNTWQKNMSSLDQLKFAASVIQKPYLKDFIQLAPRFKRKYEQVVFVNKMTKDLTGTLKQAGGNKLKDMIK